MVTRSMEMKRQRNNCYYGKEKTKAEKEQKKLDDYDQGECPGDNERR